MLAFRRSQAGANVAAHLGGVAQQEGRPVEAAPGDGVRCSEVVKRVVTRTSGIARDAQIHSVA